ncbi:hypothetical protein JW872_03820 [Candidatus Babeliales bacterium]|nr:hypothetical protein [Candidatus Babeliales bacterium]
MVKLKGIYFVSVILWGFNLLAGTDTTDDVMNCQDETSVSSDHLSWSWYVAGGAVVFGSALFGYRMYSKKQKKCKQSFVPFYGGEAFDVEIGAILNAEAAKAEAEEREAQERFPASEVHRKELWQELQGEGLFPFNWIRHSDVTGRECSQAAFVIRRSLGFLDQIGHIRWLIKQPVPEGRSTLGVVVEYLRGEGYKELQD